jgi:hypothetical protein
LRGTRSSQATRTTASARPRLRIGPREPTAAAIAMNAAASAVAGTRHRDRPRAPSSRIIAAMHSRREVPIVLSPARRPVSREGLVSARIATGTATMTVHVKNRRTSSQRSMRKNGAPTASIVTVRNVVTFVLP